SFIQEDDGLRVDLVTGVQTCALPISMPTAVHGLARTYLLVATSVSRVCSSTGCDVCASEALALLTLSSNLVRATLKLSFDTAPRSEERRVGIGVAYRRRPRWCGEARR